jgi:hypothetical protein
MVPSMMEPSFRFSKLASPRSSSIMELIIAVFGLIPDQQDYPNWLMINDLWLNPVRTAKWSGTKGRRACQAIL